MLSCCPFCAVPDKDYYYDKEDSYSQGLSNDGLSVGGGMRPPNGSGNNGGMGGGGGGMGGGNNNLYLGGGGGGPSYGNNPTPAPGGYDHYDYKGKHGACIGLSPCHSDSKECTLQH